MNGEESILATFVETNGIPGSAVCGFKLSDIEETLKSDFLTPTGIAPWHHTEHPAGCPGPEITKNRAYVRYMLDNEPIVEKSVPIISQEPLLTRTVFASFSERDLFTEIKVQNPEKIESKAKMEKTLVLIGTSRSKLLRATLNLKERLVSNQDLDNVSRRVSESRNVTTNQKPALFCLRSRSNLELYFV